MGAGLGFKTFVTGDVLTATDTNGYLMQGVWVFADAAARSAAVTSPQEGNMSFLKDTNSTEYYSGSAWVAVGGGGSYTNNGVLNSAFQIWQRGTSIANTAQTLYTSDRWVSVGTAAAYTISRQATGDTTNLPNIQYCARVQRNSGQTNTTTFDFLQGFETVNSIPYAGKTVTLSFYARAGSNYSPTSSILAAALYSGTGTDQSPTSAFTGQATVISQNATLTTTWQRFTYSATVATTATQLKTIFSMTPTGTASTNDYYEITGVQLEVGSSATAFHTNQPTIATELAACQRYYFRYSAANNTNTMFAAGYATSSTVAYGVVRMPVTMRIKPTFEQTGTAANYKVNSAAGNTTCSSVPTLDQANEDGSNLVFTVASGLTTGQGINLLAGATASYLGFSAEL